MAARGGGAGRTCRGPILCLCRGRDLVAASFRGAAPRLGHDQHAFEPLRLGLLPRRQRQRNAAGRFAQNLRRRRLDEPPLIRKEDRLLDPVRLEPRPGDRQDDLAVPSLERGRARGFGRKPLAGRPEERGRGRVGLRTAARGKSQRKLPAFGDADIGAGEPARFGLEGDRAVFGPSLRDPDRDEVEGFSAVAIVQKWPVGQGVRIGPVYVARFHPVRESP